MYDGIYLQDTESNLTVMSGDVFFASPSRTQLRSPSEERRNDAEIEADEKSKVGMKRGRGRERGRNRGRRRGGRGGAVSGRGDNSASLNPTPNFKAELRRQMREEKMKFIKL